MSSHVPIIHCNLIFLKFQKVLLDYFLKMIEEFIFSPAVLPVSQINMFITLSLFLFLQFCLKKKPLFYFDFYSNEIKHLDLLFSACLRAFLSILIWIVWSSSCHLIHAPCILEILTLSVLYMLHIFFLSFSFTFSLGQWLLFPTKCSFL